MKARKLRIALAFAIIVVLLVWLTISGMDENMQYFLEIKDLKAMGEEARDTGLRVRGILVPGSLQRQNHSLEVKFVIAQGYDQLEVHYAKELPDTFKDGSEVLVEGKYTPEGYFVAQTLMAKCPSKYDADQGYYNIENYDPETHTTKEGTD